MSEASASPGRAAARSQRAVDGGLTAPRGKHADEPSADIATARRNLAQRIERFLAAKRKSFLTAGEAANVAVALACLESRYPEGEDAMMLAEKDWPPRGELGSAVGVAALAERLEELLRA